ncbi:MAG: adenosylcobalamin-dependent ribonucleoside-diphosphate reductase [Xanthomonadales bacterium]|nr:adenosylcobalamin-dependent ribonucleoside-diphosphate reductase [Xanthomonadales bacterium]
MNTIESATVVANPADELQPVSADYLAKKYLKPGETPDTAKTRVANAVAMGNELDAKRFKALLDGGFTGGGRIMSAAGTDTVATMINCFVQPVGDAMVGEVDGVPGIMTALAEAAETMRRGGGVGYNFSAIRPPGAWVHGTNSRAGGALSYMDLFDAACKTVESAGARRGAQMAVLDIAHPEIEGFITAKAMDGNRWRNFNVSVGISDAFMEALETGADWQLVHQAEPHPDLTDVVRREDGMWVYKTVKASELWEVITRSTYETAEPGVIFADRVNDENNLGYIETLNATNPCGEQNLPPYGCCDLGSVNLTRYVIAPFTRMARFDFDGFAAEVPEAVRFLDNVLDATVWPLEKQKAEAQAKRRIGIGYYGLGSALLMLGVRYGSDESVAFTERVTRTLMEAAYNASVDLAIERGPFPALETEKYLNSGFAKRLPEEIRDRIKKHGIRNSHLLSIAPTGTMSLTWGNNASNGIEPVFALTYKRNVRQPDGSTITVDVEDYAYRLYRMMGLDTARLPNHFAVTRDLTPEDHMRVMAAAVPYIDASISKTINCPEEMSFEAFGDVYRSAYRMGLKSITTYRPNPKRGAVLIDTSASSTDAEQEVTATDPDRRLIVKPAQGLTEGMLRWSKRPSTPGGSPSWTFPINSPEGRFAITVAEYQNGVNHPFEVWVMGAEAPRILPAIAKVLSADMRTKDPRWLQEKLHALSKTQGSAFVLPMPPEGTPKRANSAAAALAMLVDYRATQLGYLTEETHQLESPMLMAMASRREPKADQGSQARYWDIRNDNTGDDFVLMVKEADLADGSRFPISVWAAGTYPKALDGLLKLLSIDMRVSDVEWIGRKLQGLVDHPEPMGDFRAAIPGKEQGSMVYPSTVAYIATILLSRYRQLGLLDADNKPQHQTRLFMIEQAASEVHLPLVRATGQKDCTVCGGVKTVVKRDGCSVCEACGDIGSCG